MQEISLLDVAIKHGATTCMCESIPLQGLNPNINRIAVGVPGWNLGFLLGYLSRNAHLATNKSTTCSVGFYLGGVS